MKLSGVLMKIMLVILKLIFFLEWWLKVAFLLDIMGMLSNMQMDFQGENKMVTVMASIVFSLKRKLKCM
jgi:hypothetical protein